MATTWPRFAAAAALLVCAAASASPSLLESAAQDQYRAQEDVPYPAIEATDQFQAVHQDRPAHVQISTTNTTHQSASIQLHDKVGPAPVGSGLAQTRKGRAASGRKQRSYYSGWSPQAQVIQASYQDFSYWQPSIYQVNRPYVIPVWGAPGRMPIYFSPQPVAFHSGYPDSTPMDRWYLPPKKPAPTYLPPAPATPSPTPGDKTTIYLDTKFGNRDTDDDRPVWDSVTQSPRFTTTTTDVVPTRKTRRPGLPKPTHPPVVHRQSQNRNGGNELSAGGPSRPAIIEVPPSLDQQIPSRPVNNGGFQQQQPPQLSIDSRPSSSGGFQQEQPPRLSGDTNNVQRQPSVTPTARQPSRCVWAIISCCSATSGSFTYSCFEQLGCVGAFWDSSPCDSDFARAAIASATNYYNNKK